MKSILETGIKPDPLIPCGAQLNQILRDAPGAYSFPKGIYQIEKPRSFLPIPTSSWRKERSSGWRMERP